MLVVLQRESILGLQATEAFVLAHFLKWSHLETAYWNHLTIIFDSMHGICKSVQLRQTPLRHFQRLFRGVYLFDIYQLGSTIGLYNHPIEFSTEVYLHVVENVTQVVQGSGQFCEDPVAGRAPEESFSWEIRHAAVGESHSHIVVINNAYTFLCQADNIFTIDFAPEPQIFETEVKLELLEREIHVHTFLDAESQASAVNEPKVVAYILKLHFSFTKNFYF